MAFDCFSSLIASLPDPTIVIGPEGTIELANRLAEMLLGYTCPGEMTGLPAERLAHPTDRVLLSECIASYLAQPEEAAGQVSRDRQEPLRLELRFSRKEGSPLPVEISLSAMNEAGARRVVLAARDISARDQAEADIREQAEQYATMRAATSEGLVVIDQEGRLRDVNEAYCQMSGYTRDELLARYVVDLEWVDDGESVRQRMRRIIEKGGDHFESQHRKKDGRIFDVEIDINFWPTRGWYFAFVHDITERKKAEEHLYQNMILLEHAHRRLAQHVRCMPLAYIVYTKDQIITEWNPAAEKIFGWREADALGKHGNIIIPPDAQPIVDQVWRNTLAGVEQPSGMNDNITKQGRRITCAWYNAPLYDAQGELIGMLAMASDITEKKRVEEALRKSEQEHKTLLRELYHRTKNNMQVIMAMLELQQMYTGDEGVIRILNDMRSRIQSMALVHQKLYQSRSLSRIDLGEYIRELAALLVESYQVGPCVRLNLDTEVIPVVIDIAIPCGLVLNELVSNAMKYAFPGEQTGQISVSIRRDEQGLITLLVADSGVGLPAGFDLRQDGRLGMQTLFALVEHQLQGQISFQTGPNAGVTFLVTFKDEVHNPSV